MDPEKLQEVWTEFLDGHADRHGRALAELTQCSADAGAILARVGETLVLLGHKDWPLLKMSPRGV